MSKNTVVQMEGRDVKSDVLTELLKNTSLYQYLRQKSSPKQQA